MADARVWFALTLREIDPDREVSVLPDSDHASHGADGTSAAPLRERLAVILDDCSPIAIEELESLPLPRGEPWDSINAPPPEAPPPSLNWRVFFATAADRTTAVAALSQACLSLDLSTEDVGDQDWAARSQRALTAVTAGDIVVAPPWDIPPVPAGCTLVVIEPSRGFGTGHHASTRLCLRALSDMPMRGLRVLDLGTGSGVLALAATLRGAGRVLGVDVDADAIESARTSQSLNPGAAAVEWLVADYRATPLPPALAGPWDVVLANLTGGMLRASAARIVDLLGPSSCLIASGFDQSERLEVVDALGLRPQAILVEDSWVGLVARR